MKKIMFNDRYGLTEDVILEYKTMTRRLLPYNLQRLEKVISYIVDNKLHFKGYDEYGYEYKVNPKFSIGEEIAIAQKYKDIPNPFIGRGTNYKDAVAWENKMFVNAEDMPHRIRIKDIFVERLQDISDKDCLHEGIKQNPIRVEDHDGLTYWLTAYTFKWSKLSYNSPRDAFSVLIDKVSGKGTWQNNPWVFVYEFELIQ